MERANVYVYILGPTGTNKSLTHVGKKEMHMTRLECFSKTRQHTERLSTTVPEVKCFESLCSPC